MRRWAFLLLGLVACGKADQEGLTPDGPWYRTTLDRDTSYLPMGSVKTQAVDLDYGRLAVTAYLPETKNAPVVIFLPGGGCVKDRYFWFGSLLASQGVATFILQPPDSLSRSGDTTEALGRIAADAKTAGNPLEGRVDLSRIVLAGHSLGSYAQSALTDVSTCGGFCAPGVKTPDGIRGLVLYGFHAQSPDDPTTPTTPIRALEVPWLVMNGTVDGLATAAKSHATFARLQDRPTALVEVVGMNHFQFTDYVDLATDRELARDNEPTVSSKSARATVGAYTVKFVRGALFGETTADDLGAPNDTRVTATIKRPRVRDDGASRLPKPVYESIGKPGLDGTETTTDIVATAAYNGATYLLARNDTLGATIWQIKDGKLDPIAFPGSKPTLNAQFGAMAVFQNKLYFGISSGNQGAARASTGAEVWSYDGMSFTNVVGRDVDADTQVKITSCAAEGSAVRVQVSPALEPGAWEKGMFQSDTQSFDVQSNDASSVTVRQFETVNATTNCDGIAAGAEFSLRQGFDEAGFGNLWNKAIMSMAVHDGTLYVGVGLNYAFGASLFASSDGTHFTSVLAPSFFGTQSSGTPKSSSVTALYSARGSLFVAANGTENYGARMAAWKSGQVRWIVDEGAPIANGFGRGTFQIASIAEQNGDLWLGGFDFSGAELLSLDANERLAVRVGDGAKITRGFGDTKQIALNLGTAKGQTWIGTYANIVTPIELDDASAFAVRTANGGDNWQIASTHGLGINAVGVTRFFEQDGVLYGVASRGSLTGRNDLGPVRVYAIRDESPL